MKDLGERRREEEVQKEVDGRRDLGTRPCGAPHLVGDVLTAFIHRGVEDREMEEAEGGSLDQSECSISR